MLQRIHDALAWITINTKTEASIWALKLQTKLTNRYPHLNKPVHTEAFGVYSPTTIRRIK